MAMHQKHLIPSEKTENANMEGDQGGSFQKGRKQRNKRLFLKDLPTYLDGKSEGNL